MADKIQVEELVSKFTAEVDEQSLRDAEVRMAEAENNIRDTMKKGRDTNLNELHAHLDQKLQDNNEYYTTLKANTQEYYQSQLDVLSDHSEDRSKLQQKMNEDIATIDRQQEKATSMFNKENLEGVKSSMGGIASAGSTLLRIFSPGLVGILGVAGLVTKLKASNDQLREMEHTARRISFAAGGVDAGVSAGIMNAARSIRAETGVAVETTAALSMGFIAEGAKGGAAQGLAREAIGLGEVIPELGTQGVADFMKRMMRMGLSAENVSKTLLSLSNGIEKLDQNARRALPEFIGEIIILTEQNKMYGSNVENSTNLIAAFSQELKAGTFSLQQLSALQSGLARADTGTQAAVGAMLLEADIDLNPIIRKSLEAVRNNPIAMGVTLALLAQDPRKKEEGGTSELLMEGVGKLIISLTDKFVGIGGTKEAREGMEIFYTQKLMPLLLGTEAVTATQTKEYIKFFKGTKDFKDITPPVTDADINEAVVDGMKSLKDALSIWEQIGLKLEKIFQNFVEEMIVVWQDLIARLPLSTAPSLAKRAEDPTTKIGSKVSLARRLQARKAAGEILSKEEEDLLSKTLRFHGVSDILNPTSAPAPAPAKEEPWWSAKRLINTFAKMQGISKKEPKVTVVIVDKMKENTATVVKKDTNEAAVAIEKKELANKRKF